MNERLGCVTRLYQIVPDCTRLYLPLLTPILFVSLADALGRKRLGDGFTLAELDTIRRTIDEAVARISAEAARGEIDAQQTAVIHLAVNYVDHVLAERRQLLLYEGRLDPPNSGAGKDTTRPKPRLV